MGGKQSFAAIGAKVSNAQQADVLAGRSAATATDYDRRMSMSTMRHRYFNVTFCR